MGSIPVQEIESIPPWLRLFSDGTVIRQEPDFADTPIQDDSHVLWKDVTFDHGRHLSLRLYKPTTSAAATAVKPPIIFYFHAGGFCFGSCAWPESHNYCLRLAAHLRALVLAPDYRLAPEHRLPAAIDDGHAALKWLSGLAVGGGGDVWLTDVDFGQVFVVGDSAGGNIAHHLAVRLGANSRELNPVRIRGYVLLGPFFGGTNRTRSEEMCPKEAHFNLEFNDKFWRLSLPEGENADHPLSNPLGGRSENEVEWKSLDPILVVACGDDLLKDRVVEYAKKLKSWGKRVELAIFEGKQHGFHSKDVFCDAADELMDLIKRFIHGGCRSHLPGDPRPL